MKKINLLVIITIMIFYFGCDNNPAVYIDCNGLENGLSVEDNCNTCDDDPTNNCIQDCNDVWGGLDQLDECGNCGGNSKLDCSDNCITPNEYGNYTSTGVDCFGTCGGNAVIDECNICNGPGEVYLCGCYGIEDGKCDCNGNIQGCDGICGSGITEDCLGLCGGSLIFDECGECNGTGPEINFDCSGNCIAPFDDCGICGGDGTTCSDDNFDACSMPDNSIYMLDGTIYYNVNFDIGGFQFNIDEDTASDANGGDASIAGFTVSAGGSTIIAFSFTGGIVPAGCGALTVLNLNNGNATGLSNIIFSTSAAQGSISIDMLYYQP